MKENVSHTAESLFQDVRQRLFRTGIVTARLREHAITTPEKRPLKQRPRMNRRFPGKASVIT
jgi:hypothetical protein